MPQHKSHGRRVGRAKGSRETNSLVSKVWSVNAMAEPAAGKRLDNIPFNFYQTSDKGTLLTTSSGAEVDASLSFQFSDFGNSSAMAGMFDQYRIREIEVWVTPTYLDYAGGSPNARYAVVVDYDNVNTITFANAQEYTNCIVAPASTGVYVKFRPHVGMTVGSNASAANVVSPWCDTAVTSVTHYGIKFSAPATNTSYLLNVRYRAHIQLRNMN